MEAFDSFARRRYAMKINIILIVWLVGILNAHGNDRGVLIFWSMVQVTHSVITFIWQICVILFHGRACTLADNAKCLVYDIKGKNKSDVL